MTLPDWLAWIQPWLPTLALSGLVMAIISMIAVPFLIVQMPADYFLDKVRHRQHGPLPYLIWLLRNAMAVLLLTAGIIMLFTPGQGLLTLLFAVMVSDLPGKYWLERKLVARPGVLKAINWVRRRYGRPRVLSPQDGTNEQ
ncbi:hypothetical protein [Gallaecimonas sp. GXIMD4217]|uniref:hypothetical protein n=1 Tax=Gallaecimonas sp. GXIMD4217 TaxID=3131927 RepID=UPI00311B08A9